MKFQARQGDVLIQQVDSLPEKMVEIHGEIILMHGEVTGHAHRIMLPEDQRQKVRYWDAGAERFLKVIETVALTHEEHGTITIEPGVYRQGFQVEDYGTEIKRVVD